MKENEEICVKNTKLKFNYPDSAKIKSDLNILIVDDLIYNLEGIKLELEMFKNIKI